ncbi:hypothetical protein BC826DRAFT_481135 [Russula brevipes]|nr:hypothetical protein BC826DRAFT_481135 [Russula brevipes]
MHYPHLSLVTKTKNLVSKLKSLEPAISYETFVEDLDPVESFTTTLTVLLVREMAKRRQQQAANSQLISDRTNKASAPSPSPLHNVSILTVLGVVSLLVIHLISPITSPSRPRRWTSIAIITVFYGSYRTNSLRCY